MRITDLYRHLLGLNSPWLIHCVEPAPERKRVDVWLSHRRESYFPCPECGVSYSVFDHVASRSWRHLNSGPFTTWVHARIPRVACVVHGIRQISIPWALPRSRCTRAFECWAIDVLRETDVRGATRLLGWESAGTRLGASWSVRCNGGDAPRKSGSLHIWGSMKRSRRHRKPKAIPR